ncbi:germin 9-2 [Olea europaea subsp. europaea]|uniref:Germin-like protein n=1 Tax=Olea europaea subsp. europaea TaxID=158383 RepID=A0A8S0PDP1_OLEEU|nr:germin 9-2 [Olea europaea subsp. europaea]
MAMAGDPDILTDFVLPTNLRNLPQLSKVFPMLSFATQLVLSTPFTLTRDRLSVALEVGFVDTTNKFFTQTLQPGDLFVFPKGLVHFQYNADEKIPTLAISAFGSSNAGTVSLPDTLFNTSIDDNVLALSFKTDVATIQKLKAGLATKK